MLDLRHNALASIEEVMRVCSALPVLRLLALAGNKPLGDPSGTNG